MIVKSSFIQQLHLDSKNQLLNSKSSLMVHQLFQALDCNENKKLDDIQFESFMNVTTDLKSSEIFKIFDLLDLDGSGCVEFDQVRWKYVINGARFYLVLSLDLYFDGH